MNRAQFQDLLDRCGSDLAKWPEPARIAAERLIARDPAAAETLEAARRLDRLIVHTLSGGEGEPDEIASRFLAQLPKALPAQAGRGTGLSAIKPEWSLGALLPAGGALWPRVAFLTFAAVLGAASGFLWAERSILEDRQPMVTASGASEDVTSVLFETDTATGTF